MSVEKNNLLSGLRSVLNYHRTIGISGYQKNEFLVAFLAASRKEKARENTHVAVAQKRQNVSAVSKGSLQTLAKEVAACQLCSLKKNRLMAASGRGVAGVRLFIVGDWLLARRQGEETSLLGSEQDQMLKKMLQAISLDLSDVYITNLIKCVLPPEEQPQVVHVQACMDYLRREILSVRPQLICAMGAVPSRAMLQRSQPLSRLRGRFYPYEVEEGTVIPLLPTYHPTFLLKNPEMKRATWLDLQALAARLGLRLKV